MVGGQPLVWLGPAVHLAALPCTTYSPARPQLPASSTPLPHRSSRPPLPLCSEEAFMSDLIAFLTDRQVGRAGQGWAVAGEVVVLCCIRLVSS